MSQGFVLILATTRIRDKRKIVVELRFFGVDQMNLASNLGSTAAPQDPDLRAAAFEFGIEPTLLLDPHADLILDANPAACTLLGYDRALLRQTRVSALHTGQLPALIVFTQAVLDKGAYW